MGTQKVSIPVPSHVKIPPVWYINIIDHTSVERTPENEPEEEPEPDPEPDPEQNISELQIL